MKNFGTSYYLKLLGLNPKPKETELIKRMFPKADASAYDFHNEMRRIAKAHVKGDLSKGTTDERIAAIKKQAERDSAIYAIRQLESWLDGRDAMQSELAPLKRVSPSNRFAVFFKPDISVEMDVRLVHIHLWNTQRPKIGSREAAGCLGLFGKQVSQDSVAILNLREKQLYRFANSERTSELAQLLIADLEKRLDKVLDDHDHDSKRPDEDRRLPPPDA